MTKPLKCTSCDQAVAGIHVLEIHNQFEISQSLHLCEECAAGFGIVASKPPHHLIGGITANVLVHGTSHRRLESGGAVCPGCHLTHAEFKLRGRLGCPRCYEVFRASLLPLLDRVHDGTSHRGRFPAHSPKLCAPSVTDLGELRTKLQAAIANERYEEAARLRDQIQRGETGTASDDR